MTLAHVFVTIVKGLEYRDKVLEFTNSLEFMIFYVEVSLYYQIVK